MLKHVCALGRIAALLIFTNWTCIFLYGRTASLPIQNRRNRHSNLCSLLLIWWVSYLETFSSCWSAAFTSRFFSMLVWVRGKILYTAWISSGLTPPQRDPIPSLNLVMNINGLEMKSVSDTYRRICSMFKEFPPFFFVWRLGLPTCKCLIALLQRLRDHLPNAAMGDDTGPFKVFVRVDCYTKELLVGQGFIMTAAIRLWLSTENPNFNFIFAQENGKLLFRHAKHWWFDRLDIFFRIR